MASCTRMCSARGSSFSSSQRAKRAARPASSGAWRMASASIFRWRQRAWVRQLAVPGVDAGETNIGGMPEHTRQNEELAPRERFGVLRHDFVQLAGAPIGILVRAAPAAAERSVTVTVSSFAPRKNALSRSERRHSRQATVSSLAPRKNALSRSERRHSRQATVSSLAPRKNALSRSERRHSRQATVSSLAPEAELRERTPFRGAKGDTDRRQARGRPSPGGPAPTSSMRMISRDGLAPMPLPDEIDIPCMRFSAAVKSSVRSEELIAPSPWAVPSPLVVGVPALAGLPKTEDRLKPVLQQPRGSK